MAQTYKVSVCSAGDPGSNPGWRSLVGYNPWGQKELDTTEQLHFHLKSVMSDFHSESENQQKLMGKQRLLTRIRI